MFAILGLCRLSLWVQVRPRTDPCTTKIELLVSLPSPASAPPAPTPTRPIVLLAVAGFASQAQVRVTDSLLPQLAGDFGTTVGAAAMVVTAYAVAHGSVQLL